jgi:hypothetical protein
MKKILLLGIIYLFLSASYAVGQSTVTFRVNVSYEIENGLFNPEEHSVQLLGDVYPLSMNREVIMTPSESDSTTYEADVRFQNNVLQQQLIYRFRLEINNRYMNEDVPRNLVIPSESAKLDAIYFNSYAW